MMTEEVDVHRVWAEGTVVEPGVLRFAHYEIAGVKYADMHLYGVADGVGTWRATVRFKGSEIDDLVMTLVPDMNGTRLVDLGNATLKLFEKHLEHPADLTTHIEVRSRLQVPKTCATWADARCVRRGLAGVGPAGVG
jgi:hypothetical protein